MKKVLAMLMAVVMGLSMVSCGKTDDRAVRVSRGLFHVKMTFTPAFFSCMTELGNALGEDGGPVTAETWLEAGDADDFKDNWESVRVEDDGTLTCKLQKDDYDQMLREAVSYTHLAISMRGGATQVLLRVWAR